MTDIDDKLLEQQEQEQERQDQEQDKEQNDLGSQFEAGGDGNENGNARTNGNGKGKADSNERPLPTFPTYKYSKPTLHEAIIVNGLPFFLTYEFEKNKLETVSDIKENSRILRPPNREEYPYTPYEFACAAELDEYLERATKETPDSLYQKAKSIVRKYNDQDDYKLNLIAIDIMWSYFQDKFGTTHYLVIVGDNDSGKSSAGNSFEGLGYRAVNMTSPTAPNVFRTLGQIEPGQCTLVLDEADKIDQSTDMMNILKSGYEYGKRVPKTNTNSWKVEWFYAYCLKLIIAERSPSRLKAKGLLDRGLSFNTVPGEPELNIKEVINPQGDPQLEQELSELLDFRKLMLVYRLVHFKDQIPDLDIGIKRRNEELCKSYIRLFYGSQAQTEVEQTFQTFLDTKTSKKAESLEATLLPVIIDLVQQKGNSWYTSELWDFVRSRLNGESDPVDTNRYYVGEYTLYKSTITRFLEDKFGAGYKHTERGGQLIFSPDKLQRIVKSYDLNTKIKTRLKTRTDTPDTPDTSSKQVIPSEDNILHKSVDISQDTNENNVNISQNKGLEDIQTPPALSQVVSDPSVVSGSELSEEEKAERLRKYDDLSDKARAESNRASSELRRIRA